MNSIDYLTVDVFTRTRFAGNPLAVVPDARGLSDAQMQRIAAEFNYSESTFVLPPEDDANTARVRIFTPTAELPFAGHPNVGTGWVLAGLGRDRGGTLRFEEIAGLDALARARPNEAAFAVADRRYPNDDDHFALFLFHRLSETHLRARMFAPLSLIPEDPATGSASAALAARLLSLRPERDVAARLVIDQGVEMGRPSRIVLDIARIDGVAQPVQVSGECVEVMSGRLRL